MNNYKTINEYIENKLPKTKIFAKHFSKVYKNYLSINCDEIESIVQFYLVKLANDPKINKDKNFDIFLFLQSKWEILNLIRKNKNEKTMIKNLEYLHGHETYKNNQTNSLEDVINYFSKYLNYKQKTIFILKHMYQKSNKEICFDLKITKSRISQILNKIYKKIRFFYQN